LSDDDYIEHIEPDYISHGQVVSHVIDPIENRLSRRLSNKQFAGVCVKELDLSSEDSDSTVKQESEDEVKVKPFVRMASLKDTTYSSIVKKSERGIDVVEKSTISVERSLSDTAYSELKRNQASEVECKLDLSLESDTVAEDNDEEKVKVYDADASSVLIINKDIQELSRASYLSMSCCDLSSIEKMNTVPSSERTNDDLKSKAKWTFGPFIKKNEKKSKGLSKAQSVEVIPQEKYETKPKKAFFGGKTKIVNETIPECVSIESESTLCTPVDSKHSSTVSTVNETNDKNRKKKKVKKHKKKDELENEDYKREFNLEKVVRAITVCSADIL
jgi:hypothetical protein